MTLPETLIASFSTMFVTSLAWLAYKHHDAYKKVFPYIIKLVVFIMIVISAYNAALMKATWSIIADPNIKNTKEILTLIKSNEIPILWPSVIWIVLLMYLCLLDFLPYIIKDIKKDKPE